MSFILKKNGLCFLLLFALLKVSGQKASQKQVDTIKAEAVFLEGMKAYLTEDYLAATGRFKQVITEFNPTAGVYHMLAKSQRAGGAPAEAVMAAEKSLELQKDNAYYQQFLAEIYTQQQEFELAIELYKKLMKRNPLVSDHYLALADIYEKLGQTDKAIALYDALERQNGLDEAILQKKQALYLQKNQVNEALEEGQKLIENQPLEQQHVLRQAQMFISNKKINEAEKLLKDFLSKNEQSGEANVMLAEVYRINGNTEACYQQLTQAFSNETLDPKIKLQALEAFVRISKASGNIQQNQKAIEFAEAIAQTNPNMPQAYVLLGDLYTHQNNPEKARVNYAEATKSLKSVFELWLALIETDLKLDDHKAVLRDAKSATEYFPNQAFFWFHYGLASLKSGNTEESIPAFEETIYLSRANTDLRTETKGLLWLSYLYEGQPAEAQKIYVEAVKENVNFEKVLIKVAAEIIDAQANLNPTKDAIEKLISLTPDLSIYKFVLAKTLFEQGHYPQAAETMSKVISGAEPNGFYHELLGDALFKLGQIERAIEQWETAKSHCPCTASLQKKIAEKQYFN